MGTVTGTATKSKEKGDICQCLNPLILFLVVGARGGNHILNSQGARDFKSLASTSSATQACIIVREIYMLSEKWCQEIHS
jgi:hypothetical protein